MCSSPRCRGWTRRASCAPIRAPRACRSSSSRRTPEAATSRRRATPAPRRISPSPTARGTCFRRSGKSFPKRKTLGGAHDLDSQRGGVRRHGGLLARRLGRPGRAVHSRIQGTPLVVRRQAHAEALGAELGEAGRMVRGERQRGRRRRAPFALRASRALYRALQGHGGDRACLSAPGVLGAARHLHHRARRKRHPARARRADALGRLGSFAENYGEALSAFTSNELTAPCAPTCTSCVRSPSASCHIRSRYLPGGTPVMRKAPDASVTA